MALKVPSIDGLLHSSEFAPTTCFILLAAPADCGPSAVQLLCAAGGWNTGPAVQGAVAWPVLGPPTDACLSSLSLTFSFSDASRAGSLINVSVQRGWRGLAASDSSNLLGLLDITIAIPLSVSLSLSLSVCVYACELRFCPPSLSSSPSGSGRKKGGGQEPPREAG